MIADIEAGLVKRVIIKDMSRLGRDYLQVGMYTEIMFPEHDIHFIAAVSYTHLDVYKRQRLGTVIILFKFSF